jgi:hypothetical protein
MIDELKIEKKKYKWKKIARGKSHPNHRVRLNMPDMGQCDRKILGNCVVGKMCQKISMDSHIFWDFRFYGLIKNVCLLFLVHRA